jgi:hypothetical protein
LGHANAITGSDRALRLAAAFVCTLALGGCGGVEFQGKVFDYMGISGDRQQGDPRMAERAPLLLPPNPKTLPQPGTGVAVATAREDWPDDPERVRKRVAKQKAAEQAKEAGEQDPNNPYAGKPTLLDQVLGRNRDADEEPIIDAPEPDPADKRPEDRAVASSGPKALTPHVPQPAPTQDPFHPTTPDSYKGMSSPSGNQAAW